MLFFFLWNTEGDFLFMILLFSIQTQFIVTMAVKKKKTAINYSMPRKWSILLGFIFHISYKIKALLYHPTE